MKAAKLIRSAWVPALVVTLGWCLGQGAKESNGGDSARIVFVCEHGSAKSMIAAQYFERLARKNGLAFTAISRGTNPEQQLGEATKKGLVKDGFDVTRLTPRRLTATDTEGAAMVISFGPDVSSVTKPGVRVERWAETPSVDENYDRARAYIVERVQVLINNLKDKK